MLSCADQPAFCNQLDINDASANIDVNGSSLLHGMYFGR
jgi:hypothetical protein